MNSSPTIIPPININFIGRGLEGIRKLKNAQQLLVESSESRANQPNAKDLLILSAADSPLLGLFIPKKPDNTSILKITMNNNNIAIKNPEPELQPVVAQVPSRDYKNQLLTSDKKLVVSSVNCAFKIIGDSFYKIQISEKADPLINEVVFTKILSNAAAKAAANAAAKAAANAAAKTSANAAASLNLYIFPKYLDHFTVAGSDNNLYSINPKIIDYRYKNYKVLVTEAINNAKSLSDLLNNANIISDIVNQIETLMTAYSHYGTTLGFIHSDLHMNNIQFETQNTSFSKPKIIDFGRCFVKDQDITKILNTLKSPDIFDKFNIKNKIIDFENEWRLVNINTRNKTTPNYLLGDCGYLCDVAQVAFSLLLHGAIQNDKPWFKICAYEQNQRELIHIDIKKIKNTNQLSMLDKGLLWLASYLIACEEVIYINKAFNSKILLYSNDTTMVYQFDISKLMNYTLLIKNSMFNPAVFNEHEDIQYITYQTYIFLIGEISNKTGGSKKNLISLHKKSKRSKKMNGGISHENCRKNLNSTLHIRDKYKYVNQINSKIPIIFTNTTKTTAPNEDLNVSENPLDVSGNNYIPRKTDFADLGKSISQLFLEEVLKNEQANQLFTVEKIDEECSPCGESEAAAKKQTNPSCQGLSCPTDIKTATSTKNWCCPSTLTTKASAGGSSSKDYKIYVCAETNRKYIRKSNERWYLDENRGKYRYSDEKKSKIVVR